MSGCCSARSACEYPPSSCPNLAISGIKLCIVLYSCALAYFFNVASSKLSDASFSQPKLSSVHKAAGTISVIDSANFSGTLQFDMIALDPTRNAGSFVCSRSDFLKPALLCALSEINCNLEGFGASASSAKADDRHHSASNMKPGPTGRGECIATAAAAACCASSSPVIMMRAPHQQRIVAPGTRQRCRCCRKRRRRSSRI